jgi:hypothetical protein
MLPDITINLNGFLHSYVLVSHFLVRIINLIMYATLPESRSLPSVTLGKYFIGKGLFVEYFFADTRQKLCRVSKSTRQRKTLGKLRIEKLKKTAKHFF